MQAEAILSSRKQELLTIIAKLKASLTVNGLPCVDPAEKSIQRFLNSNTENQQTILTHISTYLDILSHDIESELKRPRNLEANRLRRAISAFGLRAIDESVFEKIDEGDIVEIYRDTGVQLYRNVVFVNLCSYNLLDLAVHSWDELFEKPAVVIDAIHDRIQKVLSGTFDTLSFEIRPFVQKEKFIYAKTLRTYLVTPKVISPLEDALCGRRTAFITTFKADIIAEGGASSMINIL